MLCPISDGPRNLRVWNPQAHFPDSLHVLPIITPVSSVTSTRSAWFQVLTTAPKAYPAQNATANVSVSTKTVMIVSDEDHAGESFADIVRAFNRQNLIELLRLWRELIETKQHGKR